MKTIEIMLQLGVYDYIIKPFTFERLKQICLNYVYDKQFIATKQTLNQEELDQLIHPKQLIGHYHDTLPKGLNGATYSILRNKAIQ